MAGWHAPGGRDLRLWLTVWATVGMVGMSLPTMRQRLQAEVYGYFDQIPTVLSVSTGSVRNFVRKQLIQKGATA
jgi:hypothetical protein